MAVSPAAPENKRDTRKEVGGDSIFSGDSKAELDQRREQLSDSRQQSLKDLLKATRKITGHQNGISNGTAPAPKEPASQKK